MRLVSFPSSGGIDPDTVARVWRQERSQNKHAHDSTKNENERGADIHAHFGGCRRLKRVLAQQWRGLLPTNGGVPMPHSTPEQHSYNCCHYHRVLLTVATEASLPNHVFSTNKKKVTTAAGRALSAHSTERLASVMHDMIPAQRKESLGGKEIKGNQSRPDTQHKKQAYRSLSRRRRCLREQVGSSERSLLPIVRVFEFTY